MSEKTDDKKPLIIIRENLNDEGRSYSNKFPNDIVARIEKAENSNKQPREVPDVTDSADKRTGSTKKED
jgi:hypothetical protein